MRRILLPFMGTCLGLLLTLSCVRAQSKIERTISHIPAKGIITLIGGAGVAYYMGDLVDGVDLAHLGLGPTLAVGGMYRFTERLSLRSELRYYHVRAHQKYSRNFVNNLSFRSRNPDIYLGVQGDLFAFTDQRSITPYLFAGLGTTLLNPKAKFGGTWYSLAPLQTENVRYSRTPLLVVLGAGVSFRATKRWSLGAELCSNLLASDYLDDVSTVFPDPNKLTSDLARQLSDRSAEIGQPPRQPGWQRGNPGIKDSYIFLSVKASYLLTSRYFAQQGKKTKCSVF